MATPSSPRAPSRAQYSDGDSACSHLRTLLVAYAADAKLNA
jgi:hypothetical protein